MEVAVYKGDSLLCIGTVDECAEQMNVKKSTIQFYLTPSYRKIVEKRKRARNYISAVRLEDE